MTGKTLTFDPMIGFEQLFERLHNQKASDVFRSATSYPPYNILKIGEHTYLIEIAVAGFTRDALSVTQEGQELTVTGESTDVEEDRAFLHRGIASRGFSRNFTLATDTEVDGVDLENGMLTIRLKTIVPDEKKPKKFDIGGSKAEFLQE